MANSKYLRWLKEDELTTKVARRFVAFCDEDVEQQASMDNFDASIYEDAMKLILDRLENPDKSTQVDTGGEQA